MRRRVLAALAFTALWSGACLPAPEHRCAGAADCSGGVCVAPPGACAFADPGCEGGLRFGEGAGGLAGTCVGVRDAGVDAPVDAPPPPDEDDDGVPDGVDNCPHVANPDQEDLGEEASGGEPDGVGDACDPEPTRAGNRLVLFDGFNGPLSSMWMTLGGSLPTTGGQLRLDQDASLVSAQLHPRHVQVALQGQGLGMAGQLTFTVGVALQPNGQGLFGAQTLNNNPRLRLSYGTSSAADVASLPIVGTTPFSVVLTATRNRWSCELKIVGENQITVARAPLQPLTDGWLGVGNTGPPFAVDYIAVIALADP